MHNPTALCMALAAVALSANALAAPATPRDPGDDFRFQLSETMTRDSNLYRYTIRQK